MTAAGPVLSDRALNRALLARQGLLDGWNCSAAEAVTRLIGLQAQSPTAPYFGLWSRLDGFEPGQLSELMTARATVRIALMRSTLHLVTAADCLELRPVLAEHLRRGLVSQLGGRLAELNTEQIAGRARVLVEQRPLTLHDLGELLSAEFGGASAQQLGQLARCWLPLVQVTPRGVWGRRSAALHTTAEHWLGAQRAPAMPDGPGSAVDSLILRYLRAFGPASTADLAAWSGLTGLGRRLTELPLRTFADERGRRLFDVVDGALPDPANPVPVRILAQFDNLLLAHADRRRIFDDAHRRRFMSVNGLISATFLIDGFVAGSCRLRLEGSRPSLHCSPFGALRRRDEAALRSEGLRLLRFAAPQAARPEVTIG